MSPEAGRFLRLLGWLPAGTVPEISPAVLNQWLETGRAVHLVDARTGLEFRQGTISGARHAPLTGMPAALERLALQAGTPVVALCLSGHRSRPLVRWLRRGGIEAYSLAGGIAAWKKAGYALSPPEE